MRIDLAHQQGHIHALGHSVWVGNRAFGCGRVPQRLQENGFVQKEGLGRELREPDWHRPLTARSTCRRPDAVSHPHHEYVCYSVLVDNAFLSDHGATLKPSR